MTKGASAEKAVKEIRRKTRRRFSAEEKVRIVLEGLRGEESIATLCRREGIVANLYYRWSKEFLAGERTKKGVEVLRKAGWVGDLQYHPYSNQGPITDVRARVRAVSLFDLSGLKKLAETKDKCVIVVGGPCGICERTKVRALRPLLQSESTRLGRARMGRDRL